MTKPLFAIAAIAFLLSGCERTSEPSKSSTETLPDFTVYTDVNEKKQAFFNFMLPNIELANNNVLAERALIMQWMERPKSLSSKQKKHIEELFIKYRIDEDAAPLVQQQQLLRRIHPIPPSLILAQAANESAWGTSRFAKQGNNLFGQWCFSAGCGLVPEARGKGQRHEVRVFASPLESIESYIRNLNTHPSYKHLRQYREHELAEKQYSTGINLARGLINYSERGEEYIAEIQHMIRFNNLDKFDNLLNKP